MKQYDLQPEDNMDKTVGLLHSMVTYNYSRLKRLVAGLDQNEIDYRGQHNDMNSISQLLRHLAVVDLHWVFRLQSQDIPSELKASFGPMYDSDGNLPMLKNISLQTLINEYDDIQSMFKKVCTNLTDEDLSKIVPFGNENSSTIRWGIWHIADHSRHHYANIAAIKKYFKR